jgi:hypothetical protein
VWEKIMNSIARTAGVLAVAGIDRERDWPRLGNAALKAAATFWFVVAVFGQLLFAVYVADFYGRTAVQGRWQDWNQVLQAGYIHGDTLGNAVLAAHLLCAVAVMLSGAAQFVPLIRRRWPRFHRWNGRIFLTTALIASLGGAYMIWTRPKAGGDLPSLMGMTLEALLIWSFAGMALLHAKARRYDAHRRWALRFFLAVNSGWFFRIGLMFWIVANHGPVGFDPKTFTGPFLTFLAFAQYLVPLAVLELYFSAQRSRSAPHRIAVAGSVAVLTLLMAVGIAAAFAGLWLPHL